MVQQDGPSPVAGRKKKRCRLPEVFLHRFALEARLYDMQIKLTLVTLHDQDHHLDDLIPNHAVVTFLLMKTCTWSQH